MRLDSANYGPIIRSVSVSRKMESLIIKYLMTNLMDNKHIKTNHHGFIKNKSRATCMIACLDTITTAGNTGNSVMAI